MTDPHFFCTRTLLSYHPGPDLNRVTLFGPNDFKFVLYALGEDRPAAAAGRCNSLAAALTALWDKKTQDA